MAKYKDFQFIESQYSKAQEYTNSNAIILAIKNILLSKPGNFPLSPTIGMNIKQYQFELLDTQTISDIQSELNRQIALYIPDIESVNAEVKKVEADNGTSYLCISLYANINGENLTSNFILDQSGDEVNVFNETY